MYKIFGYIGIYYALDTFMEIRRAVTWLATESGRARSNVLPFVHCEALRRHRYFRAVLCTGARRHGQEGALAPPPPSGNVVKSFLCISSSNKMLSRGIILHYFHNLSSVSGCCPRPHRGFIPGPCWGTFVPRPLICPPLEKILRAPLVLLCSRLSVPIRAAAMHLTLMSCLPQPQCCDGMWRQCLT